MINLTNPKTSFILLTFPKDLDYTYSKQLYERATSIFYSKDYTILPISKYSSNIFFDSILAISESHSNEDIRKDSLFIIDSFGCENIIAKYKDDYNPVRINKNGSETLLKVIENNMETTEQELYVNEGFCFSFSPIKRYYYPKKKEDLKVGMIVEFFNNREWVEKNIQDLDNEYEKLYKLLIKYNKLRVEVNQN